MTILRFEGFADPDGARFSHDAGLVTFDERLHELGLALPEPPALTFTPRLRSVLVHAGLAYLSGSGTFDITGRVGDDLTVEDGYRAARGAGLALLRTVHDELGSLERVSRWLKCSASFARAPAFGEQPAVVNGFTDLIVDIHGEERGSAPVRQSA